VTGETVGVGHEADPARDTNNKNRIPAKFGGNCRKTERL
jgi:hypothetical protein